MFLQVKLCTARVQFHKLEYWHCTWGCSDIHAVQAIADSMLDDCPWWLSRTPSAL